MPDSDDDDNSSNSVTDDDYDMTGSDSDLDEFLADSHSDDTVSYSSGESQSSITTVQYSSDSSDSDEVRPVIIETSDDDMDMQEIQVIDEAEVVMVIEDGVVLPERLDAMPPLDDAPVPAFDLPGIDLLSQRLVRPYVANEAEIVEGGGDNVDGNPNPAPNNNSTTPDQADAKESDEPQSKKVKHNDSFDKSGEDDGQACPICFEPWTNSGEHRLVSLLCGHLFGKLCIEKWMKNSSTGRVLKGKCPQCNAVTKSKDIRPIYARYLKVLDTSERDRAVKELQAEQELRKRAELEKNQSVLRLQMSIEENNRLKKELIEHKRTIEELRQARYKSGANGVHVNGLAQANSTQNHPRSVFNLEKSLELSKEGGCRLMAVSNVLPLILASQPSKNNLFPGFGVRKISLIDFKATDFVHLHSKEIKDIAFHNHDSLILSASMDKSVKLTNVRSNSVVQTYPMEMEAWSCAWNTDDTQSNSFYVGLRNGKVVQLDIRMPSNTVKQIPPPVIGSSSPVVRLQYVKQSHMKQKGFGGLLALQLSGSCFYECKTGGQFFAHPLGLKGSFTSMSLEPSTGHILLSSRPSPILNQTCVKHMLGELSPKNSLLEDNPSGYYYQFDILNSVNGGATQTQISRSQLFLDPNNQNSPLVCAGDESSKAALIWDMGNGKQKARLDSNYPVLDVANFTAANSFCLATINQESVRFYKHQNYSV